MSNTSMATSQSSSPKLPNIDAAPYEPLSCGGDKTHSLSHHLYQYGVPSPQLSIYTPRYYYTFNGYFPFRAPCPYYACYYGMQAQQAPPMEVYRVSKWTTNSMVSKHADCCEGKRRKMPGRKNSFMSRHARREQWMPKNVKHEKCNGSVGADDVDVAGFSSLMLKNIPNKLTRSDLLALLDEHCKRVNEEAAALGPENVVSSYDFVYLPIDFRKNANKGYAFVNFTSGTAAIRATKEFHKLKWATLNLNRKDVLMSKKICEVSIAKIQGKKKLTEHLRKSVFACHTDEYLPVVFSPPRDGSSQFSNLQLVGKCLGYDMII